MTSCYLCNHSDFNIRKGVVCDDRSASGIGSESLKPLECNNCGLVTLSSFDHIQAGHYEDSGMHDNSSESMDVWFHETEQDDLRRLDTLKNMISDARVLDFGCGAGGFVSKAQTMAKSIAGVELEQRVHEYWAGKITLYKGLQDAGKDYDLITAFHVIEHIEDPAQILKELSACLSVNGRIVIEVPSSDDALFTLYENEGYQNFGYWNQHLYLFNPETLRQLAKKAGLKVITVKQIQRYPLSNHLYWLCKNKPGGHMHWSFIDNPGLRETYSSMLASLGKCDTLLAYLGKE